MINLAGVRDWTMLVLCNLMWASSFVWIKFAQAQVGPVFTTAFPIALATLLLVAYVRVKRGPADPSEKLGRLGLRDALDFVIIGVFGQISTQFLGTWGPQFSLASNCAF